MVKQHAPASTGSARSRVGRLVKRLADLVSVAVLLVIATPVFLIFALLIVFDSGRPVFFRQERLGKDGRLFRIFKFRTMVPDAVKRGTGLLTRTGDDRITRIGHFMRKYHVDELPQLLNVLRGEMSLVGPRPLVPNYAHHWSEQDRRRLLMPPGITGWQQVNGGERNSWEQRMALDVEYVDRWSLWLDLRILLRTPMVVLKAEAAQDAEGFKRSAIPPDAELHHAADESAKSPKTETNE